MGKKKQSFSWAVICVLYINVETFYGEQYWIVEDTIFRGHGQISRTKITCLKRHVLPATNEILNYTQLSCLSDFSPYFNKSQCTSPGKKTSFHDSRVSRRHLSPPPPPPITLLYRINAKILYQIMNVRKYNLH